jgi:hypothetical protein
MADLSTRAVELAPIPLRLLHELEHHRERGQPGYAALRLVRT